MRELAELSGLSEDVIEAIEHNRRRNGVTVDELMVLAHALGVTAFLLLPPDRDYLTAEEEQYIAGRHRQREADAPKRRADWEALIKLMTEDVPGLLGRLKDIPPDAVLMVERDGKMVPVKDGDGHLMSIY